MNLSKKEIEHISALARIELSEGEKETFGKELSAIIGYFQKLRELDTSAVDLNLTESENANTTRPDESAGLKIQEQILANAPAREDRFIKVKSVF